ncbi:hypothetical protein LDL36_18190 [Komagataeibacter sp. FNDCR1]|nr:hypothetical protein [Komagataeibacter sp. FNDCR1]
MLIDVDRYPQLKSLCWNRPAATTLGLEDALALYERNWRHVSEADMTVEERNLLDTLVREVGRGAFLPQS